MYKAFFRLYLCIGLLGFVLDINLSVIQSQDNNHQAAPPFLLEEDMILLFDDISDQLWYFDKDHMDLELYLSLEHDNFVVLSSLFIHRATQSIFFLQQPINWDVSDDPALMQFLYLDLQTGVVNIVDGLSDPMIASILPFPSSNYALVFDVGIESTLPSHATACLLDAFSKRCFLMPYNFEQLILHTSNLITPDNYLLSLSSSDTSVYRFNIANFEIEPVLTNGWEVIDVVDYSVTKRQFVAIGEHQNTRPNIRDYTLFVIDLDTYVVSDLPHEILGPVLSDNEINISPNGNFIQYSGINYYCIINYENGEVHFCLDNMDRLSKIYHSVWVSETRLLVTMSVDSPSANTVAIIDIETESLQILETLSDSSLSIYVID